MLLQKKVISSFQESLKFYVIVHAKIQMDCGFFFAPILIARVNCSIQYANVSRNYILQRTLTVIRLAIIILYENLRNSTVFI